MKSTSCSVFGPPRAQAARPPPSMKSTPQRWRTPAASFIAATSSSWVASGTTAPFPFRPDVQHGRAVIRIAAAGDIHASEATRDRVARAFAEVESQADVVLLAGDLTTTGQPEQA